MMVAVFADDLTIAGPSHKVMKMKERLARIGSPKTKGNQPSSWEWTWREILSQVLYHKDGDRVPESLGYI